MTIYMKMSKKIEHDLIVGTINRTVESWRALNWSNDQDAHDAIRRALPLFFRNDERAKVIAHLIPIERRDDLWELIFQAFVGQGVVWSEKGKFWEVGEHVVYVKWEPMGHTPVTIAKALMGELYS